MDKYIKRKLSIWRSLDLNQMTIFKFIDKVATLLINPFKCSNS